MRSISKFRVRVVVLNATFNNSSVILWLSFLLVGETGVPGATSKFRIIFQGEYRIYEMNVFHELMSGRK